MFKVITSYDEAAALGKCGLLWFRCDEADDWMPSVRKPSAWAGETDRHYDYVGQVAVEAGEYAILLEE